MTMVDLSLQLLVFSEVHSDVTEAVSLEMFTGFGPFFEDDLKQDYYFFFFCTSCEHSINEGPD